VAFLVSGRQWRLGSRQSRSADSGAAKNLSDVGQGGIVTSRPEMDDRCAGFEIDETTIDFMNAGHG
jgi:hypothetical protein